LNSNWHIILYIIGGLAVLWYGYVLWVLFNDKKTKSKKHSKIFAYLRLNNKFAFKSNDGQTDLEAVLNQMSEVEDTSELLEAFKEGSSDDDSNSITRKKHEKLKVIRDEEPSEEKPNPEA